MKLNLKMACILGLVTLGMMGCGSDDNDKKENEQPSVEKLANGEVCVLGLECVSGYCSPDMHCADAPVVIEKKPNGQSCASANDCASGYCGANWLCSDPPKANGVSCTNADECLSHYCSAAGICADAPKTNGMGCTNANECLSHYCNAQGVCADEPKSNGEHCAKDDDCISHYCNSEWICVDVPKANGEQCSKAEECESHYCSDEGICLDEPKANGAKCAKAEECVSHYCNDDGKCADAPKANDEKCSKADECVSHYCNDAGKCANAPKANGEKCSKAEECESHYCNDAGECANAPKANGGKCTSGADCVSNYCDSDGKCADKPQQGSDVIELQEVPDAQINTDGASCDAKTFVEHCNDNRIVWCDVDEDGKSVVKSDTCDGDYPTCALTLQDGRNHSVCIGTKSECAKGDKADVNCETDKYGYQIRHSYECLQFADGKYYYAYTGFKYCSGKCTKTSCKQETCDPTNGHKCSDDGKYTMECNKLNDGTYVYQSFNCSDDGYQCTVLEGWATCM